MAKVPRDRVTYHPNQWAGSSGKHLVYLGSGVCLGRYPTLAGCVCSWYVRLPDFWEMKQLLRGRIKDACVYSRALWQLEKSNGSFLQGVLLWEPRAQPARVLLEGGSWLKYQPQASCLVNTSDSAQVTAVPPAGNLGFCSGFCSVYSYTPLLLYAPGHGCPLPHRPEKAAIVHG